MSTTALAENRRPSAVSTPVTRAPANWNCATVPVTHAGTQPAYLKDGIPVVLEGSFVEGSKTYDSDRVIIKHTENYQTDESERAEQSYKERCAKS